MTRKKTAVLSCAAAMLMALAPSARADVKLHGLFTDNMVLQQGIPVPVWGTADEGEQVTVSIPGHTASAKAKAGKWMVRLPALSAGGPHAMTVAGKNTITLQNVLVGEVWVCSGQSNMALTVSRCMDAEKVIAASANPMIRLYRVPRLIADQPTDDLKGAWTVAGPKTVGSFSATGYFFGQALQKARGVPVGLINSSVGGTPAEAWTSQAALDSHPELKSILDGYAKALEVLPQRMEAYKLKVAEWRKLVAQAKERGEAVPAKLRRRPRGPMSPTHQRRPNGLYNGMIAPLVPYGIAGAIWYQGEANAGRYEQYRTLFPAMITCWRQAWGQGDFSFLFVQLAAFRRVDMEPKSDGWPLIREAQGAALALPNTGMALAIDTGNQADIHPKRKRPVGQRLALAARAIAYHEKIEHSGPTFKSMRVEGNKAIVTFSHAGTGLATRGDGVNVAPGAKEQFAEAARKAAAARAASAVKGFAIAGKDGKFVWADAQIVGDTVVVSSPSVAEPAVVRYAWENFPICNLYSAEGMPAVPFRTDGP